MNMAYVKTSVAVQLLLCIMSWGCIYSVVSAQLPPVPAPLAADKTGLAAIESTFAAAYPGQSPTRFERQPQKPGPLPLILAYKASQPEPHWHYVTAGFSEIAGKKNKDPKVSGLGFELTIRVARIADETPTSQDKVQEAPEWPTQLLQGLALHIYRSKSALLPSHYLNLNAPIRAQHATKLHALTFQPDAIAPTVQSVNGAFNLVQAMGVTVDELGLIERWSSRAVIDLLNQTHPGGITKLERQSILLDRKIAAKAVQGMRIDGSDTDRVLVPDLSWERPRPEGPIEIRFGRAYAETIRGVLKGRLPFERHLILIGPSLAVRLDARSYSECSIADKLLQLELDPGAVDELAESLRGDGTQRAEPQKEIRFRLDALPDLEFVLQ